MATVIVWILLDQLQLPLGQHKRARGHLSALHAPATLDIVHCGSALDSRIYERLESRLNRRVSGDVQLIKQAYKSDGGCGRP
ncbi:hypothetical protein KC360_g44 [Hortaea werneckii]|nr:hypothetical protein KC344_g42 [Hortaea werneckii]KAI7180385.1 hypothetical protein KC360_g44 [Hortaea werneckii]